MIGKSFSRFVIAPFYSWRIKGESAKIPLWPALLNPIRFDPDGPGRIQAPPDDAFGIGCRRSLQDGTQRLPVGWEAASTSSRHPATRSGLEGAPSFSRQMISGPACATLKWGVSEFLRPVGSNVFTTANPGDDGDA